MLDIIFNHPDLHPGIQSPDEYHWNVNNSVYTNVLAKKALLAAHKAATLLNRTSKHHYKHYADRMYVPYDETLQYHPEYDGYVKGKYAATPACSLLSL